MKNYRNLIPIVLVLLMVASIYSIFSTALEQYQTVESLLEQAEKCKEQKLYDKAARYYDEVISVDNDISYYLLIIDMFHEGKLTDEAIDFCKDTIDDFPKDVRPYEKLIDLYIETESYSKAYEVLDEVSGRKLNSEVIEEYKKTLKSLYYEDGNTYDGISYTSGGYVAVSKKDKWGLANAKGTSKIYPQYEKLGYYANGIIPVYTDSIWYLMNEQGEYLYNVSDNIKGTVSDIGLYSSEFMPICADGIYNYYNLSFEVVFGGYDYAGSFSNGIAAVKTGDSWSLINTKGENITSEIYEEIYLDPRGVCCQNGRVFVKKDGLYYMLDNEGKTVGSNAFDDAKNFSGEGFAAVKIDGLWGFVDSSGTQITEAYYDDAYSYSMGFAAVCEDGLWGYIDTDGNKVADNKYTECYSFNSDGVAFVCEEGNWSSLKLYEYNH